MFLRLVFISALLFLMPLWGQNPVTAAGDSAFNAFDDHKAMQLYEQAYAEHPDDYELAWKLARVCVNVGEDTEDDDARAALYEKGAFYARKAVELKPDGSNGHLFLSVALGRVALDASARQRVKMSKEIRKEAEKAIALNPQNDIAYHVLARWHRKISNLSWIEKGFADMFLGGVPQDASMEKAIANFKKAIEINPQYINHHLELGITYQMEGRDALAKKEFETVLSLPETTSRDAGHKATARERLEDL